MCAKKCVPCHKSLPPMDAAEATARLSGLSGWSRDGVAIARRFTFPDFAAALAFVNRVGALAEEEGHHPDIELGWGYARIRLWTHAINGLHENDFIMAEEISTYYGQ